MPELKRFGVTAVCLVAAGIVIGQVYAAQSKPSFRLEPLSPKFSKLIAPGTKLETIATGFGFTEGPVWDPGGFLWVSDETVNKIYKVQLDGSRKSWIDLGDPDGNTLERNGNLIDCASVLRAVISVSRGSGQYTVLVDRYQGKRFNSPNDIVVGPDGAFYFTDPTLDLPPGQTQEIPFQGVYRYGQDGTDMTLLTRELTQPNGLAFSPDGKHFYVDDSEQRNIRVYDFHMDGTISNGRVFGEEPGGKDDGVPDGMKVDARGNLFVTGPRGIWVWDKAGRHLGNIVMPEQPANLNWGDRDYGTLYITATTSVYRLRTKTHGFVPYLPYASVDARKP
ncbi:MAG: SMP-30/gluconolactonase/LRE family protein [Candidatus Acidiferrales bacterium]|jgi:gluconolactonase